MSTRAPRTTAAALACETCGRLPNPPRLRLTFAKLAAIFPIELGVHAVVIGYDLPYLLTVALLAVTATILVIWVVEPSAMRLLGGWLHARAVREHQHLYDAPALWRIRTTVPDEPGALESLTRELAALGVNILGLHVHPGAGVATDELILSAPHEVRPADLLAAARRGRGTNVHVWPTSAMALADSQTRALDQAIRVAADPDELARAVAQLLRAEPTTASTSEPEPVADAWLKVPSPSGGGPLFFARPGEAFTPGERARAQRLAQLAEAAALTRLYR
ncbi:amino acid-binding protein, partial [Pengzhenrongella sp.]|uniref:amino acid-binding protein n=1 Tax=Pengzhenrongella sp. TaxID=2888820 RepID=UPI002F93A40F